MPRHAHVNAAGLRLLIDCEGCKLTSYRDVGGVQTIGYGHCGPDVVPGLTITQAEADALLLADLARFESGVDELIKVPISWNAYSACVVLAFNIGLAAFGSSTLLRLINAGDMDGAAKQFGLWVKVTMKDGRRRTVPGLVKRRRAEASLFKLPDIAPA